VKIIDGLKLKGRPAEIPDCSREDLPQFFVEMGYKTGAEIGLYKGTFTKLFLDAGLKMYGIDPWEKKYQQAKKFDKISPERLAKHLKRQQLLCGYALKHLRQYLDTGQCQIIKKTSMEAVKDFANESLDFVYIDGNHTFRYVAEDLVEWTKKVKKGGVVAGHDYALFKKSPHSDNAIQVIQVLHAYINAFNIRNFYVLGRKKPEGKRINNNNYYDVYLHDGQEEKRDRWRSWFFIKN
jgi:hypothetical protein